MRISKMKTKIWVVALMIVYSVTLEAASESVDIFLKNPATQFANIGIYVKNLTTGEEIDSYRRYNVIPPASTMKLLTTATALEVFGSDYQFTTILEYSGKIEKGVLYGDLYIRGGGDPMLGCLDDGQAFLETWVNAIKAAGIQQIEGQVKADLSLFDGDALNPGWLWEDAGNYYAPGIFSLAYMDNTMNVQLKSGAIGSVATVIKTIPEIPDLEFESHIRCTEIDYDGAYVHGEPYYNRRYLTGSIPSNLGVFGVRGDIPNPGLLLAQHLTHNLKASGVSVSSPAGYITEKDKVRRTLVYEHKSKPLKDIVIPTNIHSVNLYAEMVFRYLATRISTPCTVHNSEMFMRNFWKNHGVDIHGTCIKDGCGLAPQDAISPDAFVQLLSYMHSSSEHDAFYQSLPVSGESGTLRMMLANTELHGRVHAKSGTISGTRNYVGYIETKKGDTWAFAVMVNSSNARARQIQCVIEQYLLDVYRRNQ